MTREEILKQVEEQYNKLCQTREKQSDNVVDGRIEKAKLFFGSITDIANLINNANKGFRVYIAPVREIRGSNMVTWTAKDNIKEIYIDRKYMVDNLEITKIQLTHEVLHGLSQFKNGKQHFFGHEYDGSGTSLYMGLDEATTQMFTEDIEQVRLTSEEDYLYPLKNIMRVMKAIFGSESLASQYLTNRNDFEYYFSSVPNFNFMFFANLMNEVYMLSKNNRYGILSQEQMLELNDKQDKLYSYVSSFVSQISQSNPDVIKYITDEVNDDIVLNKLGIDTLNKTSSVQHK